MCGDPKLTCSERCFERRKNPSRHPMTTANTDKMRRPFCWHTFLTRLHTAPNAMLTRPRLQATQTAIQTPCPNCTDQPRGRTQTGKQAGSSKSKHLSIHRWSLLKPITLHSQPHTVLLSQCGSVLCVCVPLHTLLPCSTAWPIGGSETAGAFVPEVNTGDPIRPALH